MYIRAYSLCGNFAPLKVDLQVHTTLCLFQNVKSDLSEMTFNQRIKRIPRPRSKLILQALPLMFRTATLVFDFINTHNDDLSHR